MDEKARPGMPGGRADRSAVAVEAN